MCIHLSHRRGLFLAPQLQTPRIHTWQEKVETLLEFGVDCVVVEEFSLTFAGYSPNWFAGEILRRRLSAQSAVVGYDFRYGKARGGTVETLKKQFARVGCNSSIGTSKGYRSGIIISHPNVDSIRRCQRGV